ncbi:MAG: anion transporter [Chloroflexi bacterium]|nr:anion transporter [Chloroflexota bacterium]
MLAAAIILAATYVGIASTRLPRVNIDRPAATLVGAVLMLLAGVMTFEQAVRAIDFHTLALLLGMMLLVVVLQRGGFFTLLATKAVAAAPTPGRLMVSVVVATAVFSAFLVNDVVVLLFTPVVIQACRMQRVNPVPYLIGEAMASNIGSTATIVGNPQNMIIGVTSGIPFARFFAYLAPVAAVSTLLLLVVVWKFYGKRVRYYVAGGGGAPTATLPTTGGEVSRGAISVDYGVLARSVPVLVLLVLGFFLSSLIGVSIPLLALVGGVAAMVVSGVKPTDVIRGVDWPLLVFFGGLFVVVGGARQAGILDALLQSVEIDSSLRGILSIHIFSALVSQLVSNVPLTVLMVPLLEGLPGDTLWVSLAAGATLAGNATLIGAVANIIVAEQAYREGVVVHFAEFLKVGLVVTTLTLAASMGVLAIEFHLGFLR